MAVLATAALAGCLTVPHGQPHAPTAVDSGPPTVVYVVKRRWHTDVGFALDDVHPPLAVIRSQLPGAHYVLFGFGDRHYLLSEKHGIGTLLGALWPAPGAVLVTGLSAVPSIAFGKDAVIQFSLPATEARQLEAFIWNTLTTPQAGPAVLAPGPYDGSLYYAANLNYSASRTCNTWTAQALRAAGLPVRSFGVEFSGQVWRQLQRIQRAGPAVIP